MVKKKLDGRGVERVMVESEGKIHEGDSIKFMEHHLDERGMK
jgi:hypothetical protein